MHLITLPSHFLSPGVTFNSETSLTIHAWESYPLWSTG
jgi:hypothetical protein